MRALALLSVLAGLTVGQWRPHGLGPRPPPGSQTVLDWQPAAPTALPVASDTVVLWRMDQDGGAPIDAAGTVSTYSADGGLVVTDVVGASVGIIDGAELWRGDYRAGSGVNADCAVGNSPALLNSTLLGSYTVEFWLVRTSPRFTASYETPLTVSDNATNFARSLLILYATSDYRPIIQWMTGAATYETHTATGAVPLGGWHHYAATVSVTGATRTLVWYVDGVATDTWTGLTAPNVSSGSTQKIYLGCGEGQNNGLSGSLDEFRITSRALSAAEVLADYRSSGRWSSPPASTVGPSLALTRASTGTYETSAGHVVNALSGELRCGYQGCLVEPARTNYLPRSEDISHGAWTTYGSLTVAGTACLSADGTVSGTRLTTASGYSSRFQGVTLPATTTTAAQLDISSSTGSAQSAVLEVLWGASDTATCTCSMSDGSACTVYTLATECYAQASTSSTTPVHLRLLVTTAATHTAFTFAVGPGTITPGTNGTACLGGADLQVGTWMTSHIPNGSSATTRVSDVLSVASSGLIGTAGGVYLALTPEWASTVGGSPKLLSSNAASEADLTLSGGALTWAAHAGTVTSASLGWSAVTAHTISARWLASSASLLTDGTAVTGTGGTPSISTLYLGGSSSSGAGVALSRVKVCKGRGCP